MPEELSGLKSPGNEKEIIFFLQKIIGRKTVPFRDVKIHCNHAMGGHPLAYDSLVAYAERFGWIEKKNGICVVPSLLDFLDDEKILNDELVKRTITCLFERGIFNLFLFSYDDKNDAMKFKNELLPLSYFGIRNTLLNQGFFYVQRSHGSSSFYVSRYFRERVSELCKNNRHTMTLAQLKKKLESNEIAGEKAEEFVLEYERGRISNPSLRERIQIISFMDVCAGYDVVSFESNDSREFSRFIEVKAVSQRGEFFWSANEYAVAKIKGDMYFLYLVDLSQIYRKGYAPMMIRNPAKEIFNSENWLVESETYHIKAIERIDDNAGNTNTQEN